MEQTELNEETVRTLSRMKGEPEWLLLQRLSALKAFDELSLPQPSYGLHVNAPLNITLADLRPVENIAHNEGGRANDVAIEDLSAAAAKYEAILKPLMENKNFQNKLEALHAAFWNCGILVYAPKRKEKGKAEHITLQVRQTQTVIAAIVVIAEENANITVTESLAGAGDGREYRIESVSVSAAQDATVKYATLQKLGSSTDSLISRKAQAESSSTVDWIDISVGGGKTKQETVTVLNGDGASSTITGAFFGDESQQLDILAKEVHNARSTTSNIQVKGALQGRARAIVQSFTKIMAHAANSAGHQKANVLLLSENARASPIPKLEIDNYDVKASHEASVGQLDREKLFYMMTRGMEEREAVKLVVEGFFEPLIRHLPLDEAKEDLRKIITSRIEGKQNAERE